VIYENLIYAYSVGVIIVYEEPTVTKVTTQIMSMKNFASEQYENKHDLFATGLLKLT
jgi:hypothetical protein